MKKNKSYTMMILAIGMALFGCGESATTSEAKVEEAQIALDSRNYDKAITLLGGVLDKDGDGVFTTTGASSDLQKLTAEDTEEAELLSSAAFGRAGIDLIAMLNLANTTAKANFKKGDPIFKAALHRLNEEFLPSAFAQTTTQPTRCSTIDKDFRVVSDMISTALKQKNLDDLELGLAILDRLVELKAALSSEDLKKTHLLRAVGHFSRVVISIIVATDSNGNNLPDLGGIGGVTQTLVDKLTVSFTETLDGISQSGILGAVGGTNFDNHFLSKAVNSLKKTIIGSGTETSITITNLTSFIKEAVINRCPGA